MISIFWNLCGHARYRSQNIESGQDSELESELHTVCIVSSPRRISVDAEDIMAWNAVLAAERRNCSSSAMFCVHVEAKFMHGSSALRDHWVCFLCVVLRLIALVYKPSSLGSWKHKYYSYYIGSTSLLTAIQGINSYVRLSAVRCQSVRTLFIFTTNQPGSGRRCDALCKSFFYCTILICI